MPYNMIFFKCSNPNCCTPPEERMHGAVVVRIGFVFAVGDYNEHVVWIRASNNLKVPFFLYQDKDKIVGWGETNVKHIASDIYCKKCTRTNNSYPVGSWYNPLLFLNSKALMYAFNEMSTVRSTLGIFPVENTGSKLPGINQTVSKLCNEQPLLRGLSGGSSYKVKVHVEDAIRSIVREELSFSKCSHCDNVIGDNGM